MSDIDSSENDWQAEQDARTMAEAEGIKSDPEKMKRAQKAAKRMLKEEEAKKKASRKSRKKAKTSDVE